MKLFWLSIAASPVVLIGLTATPATARPSDSFLPTESDRFERNNNFSKRNRSGRNRISQGVGFEFEGSGRLNRTTLHSTAYEGDCPGEATATQKARFVSKTIGTSVRRRVQIVNVTPGLRTRPFTDREYRSNGRSEATVVEFGNTHTLKRLRVVPGRNVFAYRITERDRVIDQGRFVSIIRQNRRRLTRNAKWYEDEVCANTSVSLSSCADIRLRRQYKCSTGKVLKTQWSNRSRSYRTVLTNRSNRDLSIYLDGDWYRMEPGERIRIRRRRAFRVRYRDGRQTRTKVITPGKRMQFRRRRNSQRLELVEQRRYRENDRYRRRRYERSGNRDGNWGNSRWEKRDRDNDRRQNWWDEQRWDRRYD